MEKGMVKRLEHSQRRLSNHWHHSGTCLKMLNDIKIEDRLCSDASSLDVMIGEFMLFSFVLAERC